MPEKTVAQRIAEMRAAALAAPSDFVGPLPPTPQAGAPTEDVGIGRRLVAGGVRVAAPIAGGALGAMVGGPVGMVAGGGLFGAGGEALAEKIEGRKEINPWEVGVEGAFGAVPGTVAVKGGRPLLSAAIGATQAAGHTAAAKMAQGATLEEATNPHDLILPALTGGIVSGVISRAVGPTKVPTPAAAPAVPQVAEQPITNVHGLQARLTKVDPATGMRIPFTDEERALLRPALQSEIASPHKPLTTLLEQHKKTEGHLATVEKLLGADTDKAQKAAAAEAKAQSDFETGQQQRAQAEAKAQAKELKDLETRATASAQNEKAGEVMRRLAEKQELLNKRVAAVEAAKAGKVYVPPAAVRESASAINPETGMTESVSGVWKEPTESILEGGPSTPNLPPMTEAEKATIRAEMEQRLSPAEKVRQGMTEPAPVVKPPVGPKLTPAQKFDQGVSDIVEKAAGPPIEAAPPVEKITKKLVSRVKPPVAEATPASPAVEVAPPTSAAPSLLETQLQEALAARQAEVPNAKPEPTPLATPTAKGSQLAQEAVAPPKQATAIPQEPVKAPEVGAAAPIAAEEPWQTALQRFTDAEKTGMKADREAAAKTWFPIAKKFEAAIAPKLEDGTPLTADETAFVKDIAQRLHGGDVAKATQAISDRVVTGPASREVAQLSKLGPEMLKAKIAELIKGESGAVNPELAAKLGIHAATGLVGAGIGASMDQDNPGEGALIGGSLGALAPAALPKMDFSKFKPGEALAYIGKTYPNYMRANLLSNPNSLAANMWGAPIGLAATNAIEEMLGGGAAGRAAGGKLLKQIPRILPDWYKSYGKAREIIEAVPQLNIGEMSAKAPTNAFERAIEVPPAAIAAGDVALRDAAMRSGFPESKAMEFGLASEPRHTTGPQTMRDFGQAALDAQHKSRLLQYLFPFMRTSANVAIATPTRVPIAGAILNAMTNPADKQNFAQIAAQQGMGTAIAFGSYQLGQNVTPQDAKILRVWVRNMAGKYGQIAGAAFEAGQAARAGKAQLGPAFKGLVNDFPLVSQHATSDWYNTLTKGDVPPGSLPTPIVNYLNRKE